MTRSFQHPLWLTITASLLLLSCTFASAGETNPTPKKVIVASTTQIADMARNIAGESAVIRCILAPGADPHTYSPTPKDIDMVVSADLCLENGLHLEGKNWMATLARDAGKPIATCTEGLPPIEIPGQGATIPDPHAWFSIPNVAMYVHNIVKALTSLDPENKTAYAHRARLYLQQLRVLDGWIRETVSTIPPQRRVLVTTHDAFNYFCHEYRFNPDHRYLSIAPVGWSTGGEVGAGMTPERRKEVVDSIKNSGAAAIFVETTISPKLIREIARETGVDLGGSLYSDSMGDAGSAGETYIGMMRENILTIVHAMTASTTGE